MTESITLKWGTLKGWSDLSEETAAALQKFADLGMSAGAMQQEMSDGHKAALCSAIDACKGEIWNDWTGEKMTQDEAKKYVMEYQT